VLAGSVESGVLLSPNVSVPLVFLFDGLTTPVTAALRPDADDEPPLLLLPPPPPLLPPPPQAARASVAAAPNAASPMILRLSMSCNASVVCVAGDRRCLAAAVRAGRIVRPDTVTAP
jgi:hypothetical protein